MNILFDINHPAHVHLFRNAIKALRDRGDTVVVVARDKEVTLELLEQYGIKYVVLTKARRGLLGLAFELIVRQLRLLPILLKNKIEICLSVTAASSIHIARFLRIPYIIFHDSEVATLQNILTYPFATTIYTPSCYRNDHGKRHVKYPGYHELAYLAPNYFKPDKGVYHQLGLDISEKYYILRFVSWQANHDIGQFGFSIDEKIKVAQKLSEKGRVFITSENPLNEALEPYRIRIPANRFLDALFFAEMLVTDSQTVTTESALLGTPAIRYNTWVGENDMGNFIELEKEYGLIYSFNTFSDAFDKMNELLKTQDLDSQWDKKRKNMLKDKCDVTEIIVKAIDEIKK